MQDMLPAPRRVHQLQDQRDRMVWHLQRHHHPCTRAVGAVEAVAWDGGFVLRQIRDIRAIAFARSSQNMLSVSLGRATARVPTLGRKLQHTARMGAHANCMRGNRRPIQALCLDAARNARCPPCATDLPSRVETVGLQLSMLAAMNKDARVTHEIVAEHSG